jgi:hypothetical protein
MSKPLSLRVETLPDEEEERRLDAIRATHGLEVFDPEELEVLDDGFRLIHHVPTGTLWAKADRHHAGILGRAEVRVVFEGKPSTPRYLMRTKHLGHDAPSTIGEWRERHARREAARERATQEQERKRAAARRTNRPVTLNDLGGRLVPASPRAALERLDRLGGRARLNEDGRLVVELPQGTANAGFGKPARALAEYLYRAEAVLVAVADKGGTISATRAPDTPLLPNGVLAP